MPETLEKLFENGDDCYCLENTVNGNANQMLEHLISHLEISDIYIVGDVKDTLNLEHPDFFYGLEIIVAQSEKEGSVLCYYFVKISN